jgi:hypothetical protein
MAPRVFFDQFSDHSLKTLAHSIQENPQLPVDLIKTAALDMDENDMRPDTAFAWPERRLFPIDSPGQAVVSKLYMTKQASVPADVVSRCDRALAVYGVIVPLQEKVAAAPSEDDYLFPENKRYLVKTAEDVKLAADALWENRFKIPVAARTEACVRLLKIAANNNVRLPDSVLKLAGATCAQAPQLKSWLDARALMAKKAGHGQVGATFEKMARAMPEDGLFHDTDDLAKLASAIDELDRAAGLDKRYGRDFPDAVMTVFNTTKIADDTLDVAGQPVPMDVLLSVDPAVYADLLGDDLAAEFAPGGEIDPEAFKVIWPTVPYDLQKALRAQLGV